MAKATAKFTPTNLDSADLQMVQNEILKRLAIKQGTNLSPHDSHSSSHSKNSVTLKGSRLAQVSKTAIAKKTGGRTTPK